MDIYLTIEEKYLQAVDELWFGEKPKALKLLNEIIANDPLYARAHYQLGKIYYYDVKEYQTAGYHFKTCNQLEPSFPDVYYHYLHLLVFLDMEKQVQTIAVNALNVPGINAAYIYNLEGFYAEKKKDWKGAIAGYRKALLEATSKQEKTLIEESIERIKAKKQQCKKYNYELSE